MSERVPDDVLRYLIVRTRAGWVDDGWVLARMQHGCSRAAPDRPAPARGGTGAAERIMT